MVKLDKSLPNLAENFLQKSTSAMRYCCTENNIDVLWKFREDMVGGPAKIFLRKIEADEILTRGSSNNCISTVGINANQLDPYFMCQPMPTKLFTSCEFGKDSQRVNHKQNKTANCENMVLSYIEQIRPD